VIFWANVGPPEGEYRDWTAATPPEGEYRDWTAATPPGWGCRDWADAATPTAKRPNVKENVQQIVIA